MAISQNTINSNLLSEINNRRIQFPDFASFGKINMASFIWRNSNVGKLSNLKDWNELAEERSLLELEVWCKEIYCNIQKSLNLCVTSNPSSTISINAEV